MGAQAFLLAFALLAGGEARDEFGEQFARLGSVRAEERAAAERWLEAHLDLERYPQLAAAARAGDAEVRGRLRRVLGADARLLGLALALSAEGDPELALLGRESVRASVARFDPRLGEPGLRGPALFEHLRRTASASAPVSLLVDARGSLEDVVEELELAGELPLGLTLELRAASRKIRREEATLSGSWDELLARLGSAMPVTIEGHALAASRTRGEPEAGFLRLTADGEAGRTGVEVLTDWLVTLAASGDAPARTRAARNLAATRFAPALEWLDTLARRGDRAALEGLLDAAARGRVAPALTTPALLRPLLAEAERQGGRTSQRILWALAHAACFDEQGVPLAPQLAGELEAGSARARWVRLFLLERMGCATEVAAVRANELLAAQDTPPALRLQALFLLAGVPAAVGTRVRGLETLLRLGLDATEVERLGRALLLLGLDPPHADPAGIPADWSARERLDLLQVMLWRGAREPLARHVAAWLAGAAPGEGRARGEALDGELRPWLARGGGALVGEVLERARALAPAQAEAVERTRLLLGLLSPSEIPAVLGRLGLGAGTWLTDPAVSGALAGYPVPLAAEADARAALLAELEAAVKQNRPYAQCAPLVAALERTARGLYGAGRDEPGDSFTRAVRRSLRAGARTELARGLERQFWPPTPGALVRDLARELARCEVPASL